MKYALKLNILNNLKLFVQLMDISKIIHESWLTKKI